MSHHLLGIAEASALLGVSRQRVDQLAAAHPDFPRPEAELAAGRIWSRAAVEGWAATHGHRPPGRRVELIDRFTARARHAFALAEEEARSLNHNYRGCEHLVIALVRESEGIAARALASFGFGTREARAELGRMLGPGPVPSPEDLPFTAGLRRALHQAEDAARELGHDELGTEHLLLGVLRDGENVGCRLLTAAGVDLFALRLKVLETTGFSRPGADAQTAEMQVSSPALDQIAENLAGIEARLERLERRLP